MHNKTLDSVGHTFDTEPEWMKQARQVPLYSQPSERNHQSRLLPGQSRGNAKPATK